MSSIIKKIICCSIGIVVLPLILSCNPFAESELEKQSKIRERLISNAKMMNKQCPVQVDECTIFKQVVVSGNIMFVKTTIKDGYVDFVDFDMFKEKMSRNYSKLLEKDFVKFIKKYGFSIKYVVYDEDDKLITTIDITGADILKYYN